MELQEVGLVGVDWIGLVGIDTVGVLLYQVMYLRVP
jgi:hypothetical protein